MLLRHPSFTPRSYVMPFLLAILVCLLADVHWSYCTTADQQAVLPNMVKTAAEMKTLAEEKAAEVKEAYSQKRVTANQYKKARSLYVSAQSAIDGWVGALGTAIDLGQDIAKSDLYSESLKTAAGKAEQFITYANALLSEGERGTNIIQDFLKVLADSAIQIWREYRSANQKQKEAIIKRLEGLKWQPFNAIKISAE